MPRSVRKIAEQMGRHRTTSFRWRHRLLTLPRAVKEQALDGMAEADKTCVLRSFKGAALMRKPVRIAEVVL